MLVESVKRLRSAGSLPTSQVSDLYSSCGNFLACLIKVSMIVSVFPDDLHWPQVTRRTVVIGAAIAT